jgi:hypothetical protein
VVVFASLFLVRRCGIRQATVGRCRCLCVCVCVCVCVCAREWGRARVAAEIYLVRSSSRVSERSEVSRIFCMCAWIDKKSTCTWKNELDEGAGLDSSFV